MGSSEAAILLLAGRDAVLLDTRMKVLKSVGHSVVVARTRSEGLLAIGYFCFHAVILCRRFSEVERQFLGAEMWSIQPDIHLLDLGPGVWLPRNLIEAVRVKLLCAGSTSATHARRLTEETFVPLRYAPLSF